MTLFVWNIWLLHWTLRWSGFLTRESYWSVILTAWTTDSFVIIPISNKIDKKIQLAGMQFLTLFLRISRSFYSTPEILPGIGLSDHNSLIVRPSTITKKARAEKVLRRTVKPSSKISFGRWISSTDWSFLEMLPNCTEN